MPLRRLRWRSAGVKLGCVAQINWGLSTNPRQPAWTENAAVRTRAGDWIDVSSISGDLVINSGDMLQEATGGYYPSTTHRVNNPGGDIGNTSRISIPFFLTARRDVKLSDRYTAGSYLDERLKLISR